MVESALRGLALNVSVPVTVIEFENATAVVYCAPQMVQPLEPLTPAQIDPVLVGTYAEVFGIKEVYIQLFSSVITSNFGNYIEVHTDLSSQPSKATAMLDQVSVRNAFNAATGGILKKSREPICNHKIPLQLGGGRRGDVNAHSR